MGPATDKITAYPVLYPIEPYASVREAGEDRNQKQAYHENRHRGRSLAYSRSTAVHRVDEATRSQAQARSLSADATTRARRRSNGGIDDEAGSP